MQDPRFVRFADTLINHSVKLMRDEVVYIEAFDIPVEMLETMVKRTRAAGGIPLVSQKSPRLIRQLIMGGREEDLKLLGEVELFKMKKAQAYIGMRGAANITENSDIPKEKMQLFLKHWQEPVHTQYRVPKTKWVVTRWPTPSMAQLAQMSTEAFEDFFFDTCTLDYDKMSKAMDSLIELMSKTDEVRLVGQGTDLRFSIKGIPVIKCDGERNIPDGEVYTAPIKDSVNGTIRYNTRSVYLGKVYENVEFTFKEGKIVEARSSDTASMNAVLDTDEGARYIGEFAIGLNPYITRPMLDTLFDEKIAGSIHLTPGNSYDEAFNGNRSAVHWDLVLIQTKEWGGGELYFDDVLVRKDGVFVLEELKCLNPEALK
ncbi:MAG: aminopeptidase [Methanomassiliicoccales archaeon]